MTERKRPWWHVQAKYVAAGMILFLVLMHLYGCQAPPTPFATSVEVPPPAGCVELRKRGGAC